MMIKESTINTSIEWFLGNNRQKNLRIVQCSRNAPLFLTINYEYAKDYADFGVWKVQLKDAITSQILDFNNIKDIRKLKWPLLLIKQIQSGQSDLNALAYDMHILAHNKKEKLYYIKPTAEWKKISQLMLAKCNNIPNIAFKSHWQNEPDYDILIAMWYDIFRHGFSGFTHVEFGNNILGIFNIDFIDKISINKINDKILENQKTYFKKYQNEPDINSMLKQFQLIGQKLKYPQNDIDWWIKKPYSDFKNFIINFDNRNKRNRRDDNSRIIAMQNGEKDGYEIWYIPTWEAAKELGRNYKGRAAKWCISSDDPDYWFENHYDDEFIFLIREQIQKDENDKIAIQFENGARNFNINNINTWNIENDNESTFFNDDLIKYAWDLLKDSGYKRAKYYENEIVK